VRGLYGDVDGDRDIDLDDYAMLADCLNGPIIASSIGVQPLFTGSDGALSPECEPADFDADGDVDLNDFAEFQRLLARR
jgi:hypothetical protein